MESLKMLSLAAIAAGALMAFANAGTASATELDCSASTMCSAPTTIHAVSEENIALHAAIDITCEESTFHATVSTGSSSETVSGPIEAWTLSRCGGWTVTAIPGHLGFIEIHTRTANHDDNGTLTLIETEITVEGFGLHCIYGAGTGHDIGTLTGSSNTGSTATIDTEAELTRVGGRSGAFCGGTTAKLTGRDKITTPMFLDVT